MLTKSKYWYAIKRSIPSSMHQPLLSIYYGGRSFMYKGNAVHCPVCKGNFSAFVNGHICPNCGSGKRHRLMYLFLQQKTNFFIDNLRVLHFAPEHCFYKRFARMNNLNYTSGDLDSPRAMEKIDMTDIQYPSNSFDVVISSHVLEHVPDDNLAMKELWRVLKPGGWAIHQAPIDYSRENTFEDASIVTNEGRLKSFGHIDHKRIYGTDYSKRLEKAGFSVKEDLFVKSFSDKDAQRYGLDRTEVVYFCRKSFINDNPEGWNDQHLINYSEKPFV